MFFPNELLMRERLSTSVLTRTNNHKFSESNGELSSAFSESNLTFETFSFGNFATTKNYVTEELK